MARPVFPLALKRCVRSRGTTPAAGGPVQCFLPLAGRPEVRLASGSALGAHRQPDARSASARSSITSRAGVGADALCLSLAEPAALCQRRYRSPGSPSIHPGATASAARSNPTSSDQRAGQPPRAWTRLVWAHIVPPSTGIRPARSPLSRKRGGNGPGSGSRGPGRVEPSSRRSTAGDTHQPISGCRAQRPYVAIQGALGQHVVRVHGPHEIAVHAAQGHGARLAGRAPTVPSRR